MATMADSDWERDKKRFVSRISATSTRRGTHRVADDRTGLWSPLARQFAAIGRDLYAGSDLVDILSRVVTVAVCIVPGAAVGSVTLGYAGTRIHTPSRTDESAVIVDQLQESYGEGPFWDTNRPEGTGIAASSDLAYETSWPSFGPRTAAEGVRSVLAVGAFPGDEPRLTAVSVYGTEPRALAAANPDALLILAAFASAALDGVDVVAEDELRAVEINGPLLSGSASERAARFLMNKRHRDPSEVYDILLRASAEIVDAWYVG